MVGDQEEIGGTKRRRGIERVLVIDPVPSPPICSSRNGLLPPKLHRRGLVFKCNGYYGACMMGYYGAYDGLLWSVYDGLL